MEASERPMETRVVVGRPGWHENATVHHMPHNAAKAFRSRMSGGAIVAGGLVALALEFLFIAFGGFLGIGAASVAPLSGLSGIATSVGIWVAVSAAIATFIGGYIAARLAGTTRGVDGMWHGVTTWGLLIVAGVLLAGLGVTGVLGFGISSSSLLHAYLPSATSFAAADLTTAANIATTISGWFLLGVMASAVTAVFGGWVGGLRLSRRMEEVAPEEEEEFRQRAA